MIVVKVDSPVFSTIKAVDIENQLEQSAVVALGSHFSYKVKDCYFMPKYRAGLWDGTIKMYNHLNGGISTGHVPQALRFLRRINGVNIRIVDPNGYLTSPKFTIDKDIFKDTEFGNSLFDDQVFALTHLLSAKRGIGDLATGFGKSVVTAALFKILMDQDPSVCRCLIIVPTVDLVGQMYDTMSACNLNCGVYYGSQKDEIQDVTIASWQSLQNVKDNLLMRLFNAIVIDEAQGASGKEMQAIMNNAINAHYRYGVTGTIPKDQTTFANIRGITGDVLVKITSDDLQKRNRLTKCTVVRVNVNYSKDELRELKFHTSADPEVLKFPVGKHRDSAEKRSISRWVAAIERRQQLIANICKSGPTIILVNNRAEGRIYEKAVEGSIYLNANTDKKIRAQAYQDMRDGKLNCIIGTYKLVSAGLDIPCLKNIIFGGRTKSFINVVQGIGRTLRIFDGKNMAYIWDLVDNIKGFREGYATRLSYYKEKKYLLKEMDF